MGGLAAIWGPILLLCCDSGIVTVEIVCSGGPLRDWAMDATIEVGLKSQRNFANCELSMTCMHTVTSLYDLLISKYLIHYTAWKVSYVVLRIRSGERIAAHAPTGCRGGGPCRRPQEARDYLWLTMQFAEREWQGMYSIPR